jgi:hypothetical protein
MIPEVQLRVNRLAWDGWNERAWTNDGRTCDLFSVGIDGRVCGGVRDPEM